MAGLLRHAGTKVHQGPLPMNFFVSPSVNREELHASMALHSPPTHQARLLKSERLAAGVRGELCSFCAER